jgi:hypothetical protein
VKTNPPPSGDYGYDLVHDLAHDDVRRGRGHADQARPVTGGTSEPSGKDARDEDLGYDEAHDF